jgi:hypothetical protein
MKLDFGSAASCTLGEGAEVCLVYKITGSSAATVLKEPGGKVTIDTVVKQNSLVVGQAAPVTVAQSARGANYSIVPESDGEVYIAASTGNTEFISSDAAGDAEQNDDNAYLTSLQVKIGYINYTAGDTVGADGSAAFAVGADQSGDTATLTITNGQFSASPGGVSQGRVFLQGVGSAIATVVDDNGAWTATWNLTTDQLKRIGELADPAVGDPTPVAIVIKVDATTMIDSGTDAEPEASFDVKLAGKTSITAEPVTSVLRRIPYDGKVCKAYNIPSPTGAADILSLRITNDSDVAGKITGTLYSQEGEELGKIVDLLDGHIDYTKNPPVARTTLGLSDPLQLQPRETVILNSKNIAERFGQTSWEGKRYVLEIQSTIQRIEVFNLLRNVENITLQPLSNVSTSAKNAECSPIP